MLALQDASLLRLTREDLHFRSTDMLIEATNELFLMSYFVLHVSYRTKRYTLKMLIPTVRVVLGGFS